MKITSDTLIKPIPISHITMFAISCYICFIKHITLAIALVLFHLLSSITMIMVHTARIEEQNKNSSSPNKEVGK